MNVAETARALNIGTEDLIYRYLRTGVLQGRKVNGRWDIDPASVEERKRRVAHKRSSRSNLAAERERRRQDAAALFAPVGCAP